jgi:hypothetical protein
VFDLSRAVEDKTDLNSGLVHDLKRNLDSKETTLAKLQTEIIIKDTITQQL